MPTTGFEPRAPGVGNNPSLPVVLKDVLFGFELGVAELKTD